jgi:putative ATP-dependent endonuclease of OLD family
MIIESVRIKNFRSIVDLSLDVDSLTVLLGANSAGKSSIIKALEWFFGDAEIQAEDVRDQDAGLLVSVSVTFVDFTDADRGAFPGYTVAGRMTLLKTRNLDGTTKLTGRGLVYPVFREIRNQPGAREVTNAYRDLRAREPELALPEARSKPAALQAMQDWEQNNPARCEEDDTDATHLLGVVGGGVLRQRFKFVLVPAMRDAADEAREGKGSALSRLLSAIAEQRTAANQQLAELETEMQGRYETMVAEAHGATLDALSVTMTGQIRALVSRGKVSLEARPATLTVPGPHVVIQAGESESLTDIGRQGHGFQRAFIIAALQYLSEVSGDETDAPTIFLALEEPELYQHPVRARHFASVLDRLAGREGGRVQVLYATHSPYFVNAHRFESIRLLRRAMDAEGRLLPPAVSQATTDQVEELLNGVVERDHIPRRLRRTIDSNPNFREAFFADAVVLVEGSTDALVTQAIASANGLSLEAEGITVAFATKTGLPVALAILQLLEIPTFVMFDGDFGCKENDSAEHRRMNIALQSMCGVAEPVGFPETGVFERHATFNQNLEAYLREQIDDFDAKCAVSSAGRDWRARSGETYAAVLGEAGASPPVLVATIDTVRQMVNGSAP